MQFIRIIDDGTASAHYNMALDEALCETVRKKQSPTTLRLYEWERPSVSIGHFQKVSDIDTELCQEKNYSVVRRLTGGRAILHDAELTYSFSAHNGSPAFEGNLLEDYKTVSNAFIAALAHVNIQARISFRRKRTPESRNPACFKALSFGEITVDGKKLIGSAQKRYSNGFLQHGSILMNFDPEQLRSVLKINSPEAFTQVGSIDEFSPSLSLKELKTAIKKAFEEVLKVKMIHDGASKCEMTLARELEKKKYSTRGWNFSR